MKMTADMWSQIYNLTPDDVPDWQDCDFYLIQRLDNSINYIGQIQITYTTGGRHTGNSTHYRGEAADFAPRSMSMWEAFITLQALGWQRVGVRPSQGIIHADIGELDQTQNYSHPYFFFESATLADAGPISAQSQATLATIPGYDPDITVATIDAPVICGPNATVSVAQNTDPLPDPTDEVQPDSETPAAQGGILQDLSDAANIIMTAVVAIPLFWRIIR